MGTKRILDDDISHCSDYRVTDLVSFLWFKNQVISHWVESITMLPKKMCFGKSGSNETYCKIFSIVLTISAIIGAKWWTSTNDILCLDSMDLAFEWYCFPNST